MAALNPEDSRAMVHSTLGGMINGLAQTGVVIRTSDNTSLDVSGSLWINATSSWTTYTDTISNPSDIQFRSIEVHQTPREIDMSAYNPTLALAGRGLYIVYIVDPKNDKILANGATVIANSPENARVKVFKAMRDDLNYDDLDVYVGKLLAIRNKKDFDTSTE